MSKCKPTPTNSKLYAEARAAVKARVNRWPSIYASSQVVQEYKARGGTYSSSCSKKSGGLTKWFREKWVNVCYPDLPACGRQGAASSEAEYRSAFPKEARGTFAAEDLEESRLGEVMHGHHWKALGLLAASVGAVLVYWANERGYRAEARALTVGALLAGGVGAALEVWTEGEQQRSREQQRRETERQQQG